MSKITDVFPVPKPVYSGALSFIAGLECEIEEITNPAGVIGLFHAVNDGSLRNSGLEYVSTPMVKNELVENFKILHKTLKFKPGGDPFSVRTSTHVHINCQSLSVENARTLVLLYALFEEFFFYMVKPARRDNIHCVPLTETAMPRLYKGDLMKYYKNWHKYTALNLKRLSDLGTMEFRHLHGTNDAQEVSDWLTILENLWTLCQRVSINEQTLNREIIADWFFIIFGHVPRILALRPTLFDIIRNSLIDVKLSV